MKGNGKLIWNVYYKQNGSSSFDVTLIRLREIHADFICQLSIAPCTSDHITLKRTYILAIYVNICLFVFPISISWETINGKFYQTKEGDIFQEYLGSKIWPNKPNKVNFKTAEKTDLSIHLQRSEDQLVLPMPCITGKFVLSQTWKTNVSSLVKENWWKRLWNESVYSLNHSCWEVKNIYILIIDKV